MNCLIFCNFRSMLHNYAINIFGVSGHLIPVLFLWHPVLGKTRKNYIWKIFFFRILRFVLEWNPRYMTTPKFKDDEPGNAGMLNTKITVFKEVLVLFPFISFSFPIDCQVSYATEAVMSSCHGRRKCSIGADVGTFGKPGCPPGTRLFLKVVHTCGKSYFFKTLFSFLLKIIFFVQNSIVTM